MDIPIPDQIPYTGEEGGPQLEDTAAALHLPRSEINEVWINKRDYSGIPVDFLYEKAKIFTKALSMDALESVLTMLIYGQVLFHHCDKVVDRAAIKIFPRILFLLYLNEEGLTWIQRIMRLSYDDIVWYPKEFEGVQLFDRCGEFPNVPLLGTQGGITYNPIQPKKKNRFIKAWYEVKKVAARDLGTRIYTPSDLYFKWIYDRVVEFGIPYPSNTPVVPRISPPEVHVELEPYVPAPNEDLATTVAHLRQEKADLEKRLQEVEAEKAVLMANAK
ncbi:uncharacterized protein LOC131632752 [Vicia villosa]|uniref:uncharacterized protein LOC131632752 n=1 Tax=Vicia villosa TaxID=3911 RepID=UPI00273CB7B3|nr:uncharacterized protein LOC131632752 [Vicia villosa]